MTNEPLSGLRVIECVGWNGVLAGRLLADAGAAVVRIVPPSGDPLDAEPPFFGEGGPSIQATWYNAGKRLLTIDLDSDAGREQLLQLARSADILLEDLGSLTGALVGSAAPTLTRVSITPMGLAGPLAGWTVNDLVANAMSGSASVTGNESTPPISGYGNQSYHTVGMYAAACALVAHRVARLTGQPQHVDLSAHEALVSCTEQVLMQWFFPNGTWGTPIARRQGSLHWSSAYEVYRAADGHGLMVTAALRFADVLLPWIIEEGAAQDLANPEKYPNVIAMIRDLPYVMKVLRDWVGTGDAEALFYEGQRRHQPFGVVWNIEEALTRSPQIEARGYLKQQEVPGFGRVGFPGRLIRTTADGPRPAPATRLETVGEVGWESRTPAVPAPARSASASRPLEGVRILDFTHVLAGPFGTRVLGDLGADVIKVGTALRSGGANNPDHPYYTSWNRNKRSVSINMASDEGRAVARRLASKSDVIIENFSAGVLARWGLDRAGLADINPGVSVVSMGGMGQDGPWKDFVTFAPTIHALTGLTYLTNPPGEHTLGYGFSLTDHLSGLAGSLAALYSLEYRERSGHGLTVDLSQYELGLGIMAPALLDYLANGTNPEPAGNRHPFDAWAPHGIYRCAGEDEWIAIAVRGDYLWQRLAETLGVPALATDPRFASHGDRIANQDTLDELIGGRTRTFDRYELASLCQQAGIAAGPVQNARDLATRDPQLAFSEFFGETRSANWGKYGIDRFPARFNGERPPTYEGVHAIGEDTFDVLTALLGYTDDEVAELIANGALS